MFDMPPDIPSNPAPIVLAQATHTAAPTNVNWIIGVCHLATNSDYGKHTAVNSFGPVGAAWDFLNSKGRHVALAGTMEILGEPTHGTLEGLKDEQGNLVSYRYLPVTDYVGWDRASFLVRIEGYKVEVRYEFNVATSSWGGNDAYDPYEDRQHCPKGGMWTISPRNKP